MVPCWLGSCGSAGDPESVCAGKAVVATSLAFGILHANPVGITVAGLVLAVLYLRTGTLLVPIAFHAANNLVATIPEFRAGSPEPMDVAAVIQEFRDTGLALWGVAGVAVTLPVLVWYLRRHWPGRGDPRSFHRVNGLPVDYL